MTMKMNERDAPVSRAKKKKSINVLRSVATGVLVIVMIVMLLLPFFGNEPVIESSEVPSAQETMTYDGQTYEGLSKEGIIPLPC